MQWLITGFICRPWLEAWLLHQCSEIPCSTYQDHVSTLCPKFKAAKMRKEDARMDFYIKKFFRAFIFNALKNYIRNLPFFIWKIFKNVNSFIMIYVFPVWLQNRLISAGLEPVLCHTGKLCIVSNYRQFSTFSKIKKNMKFVSPGHQPLGANKTGFNFIIFHFNICGKLSVIRWDKWLFCNLLWSEIYIYVWLWI